MKTTYLIGNGFDLNLGLQTKYSDFYKYYLALPRDSLSDYILQFRKDLEEEQLGEISKWADLELALGQYMEKFEEKDIDGILGLLNDVQDSLAEYVDLQDVHFSISEENKKKVCKDLFYPEQYLTPREQQNLNNYKRTFSASTFETNILIFNYTKTFEKVFDYSEKELTLGSHTVANTTYSHILRTIEHIHGDTNSNMILGVNDISQICNEKIREMTKLRRAIVKPEMNLNAGTLRDDRAASLINTSDLVCIYGMSLGETDKTWWQLIANKMTTSNLRVIIFSRNAGINQRQAYLLQNEKDEMVDRLLNSAQINPKQKDLIRDRVFVCFNSNMFNAERIMHSAKKELSVLQEAI